MTPVDDAGARGRFWLHAEWATTASPAELAIQLLVSEEAKSWQLYNPQLARQRPNKS